MVNCIFGLTLKILLLIWLKLNFHFRVTEIGLIDYIITEEDITFHRDLFQGLFFYGENNFMAWFHQYQFIEVTDSNFPKLRSKALPIVSYEMNHDENKILGVLVNLGPGNNIWFKRDQFRLYKSSSDFIKMTNNSYSTSKFNRFIRSLGLRRF